MKSPLPTTGTNALLEELSPFIPDAFLIEQWPHTGTGGRQGHFSAAQLWRVHQLVLLTPAHSINLVVQMLPEQRAWRQFAHLPNRHRIPDVRMLHEFRRRVGVAGLRRVNEVLLAPLLEALPGDVPTLALMDATDLPAADRGFKKNQPDVTELRMRPSEAEHSRPDRAAALSATRNIRFGCGYRRMQSRCSWSRWSVGSRQPTLGKADYWFQHCDYASSVGVGDRTTSSSTWVIWRRPTSGSADSAGK